MAFSYMQQKRVSNSVPTSSINKMKAINKYKKRQLLEVPGQAPVHDSELLASAHVVVGHVGQQGRQEQGQPQVKAQGGEQPEEQGAAGHAAGPVQSEQVVEHGVEVVQVREHLLAVAIATQTHRTRILGVGPKTLNPALSRVYTKNRASKEGEVSNPIAGCCTRTH